jgi:hypothetical protein
VLAQLGLPHCGLLAFYSLSAQRRWRSRFSKAINLFAKKWPEKKERGGEKKYQLKKFCKFALRKGAKRLAMPF